MSNQPSGVKGLQYEKGQTSQAGSQNCNSEKEQILIANTVLHRRYKIIKLLGQGDFGKVYQARDQHARIEHSFVALKQMPMQMIVDCERQADLAVNLMHPAIPRIFGYFATQTHSYLVKQFIQGNNLETVLSRESGFLPEERVIKWAIQLADVLDYLHTHPHHPIVFRDLKPNNIMVDRKERLYLVDFDLARVFPPRFFEHRPAHYKHLSKGLAIGTAGYSPPEQYRGRVVPQSDLYALGASLHHLLTKRDPRKARPFTFQDHPIKAINPTVSPELETIVMKALQQDIKQRFSTAKEMQSALQSLI
jgi:serine/threonine protein kinase